jgi:uncharacterized repeat protein (TIGR01451 family)
LPESEPAHRLACDKARRLIRLLVCWFFSLLGPLAADAQVPTILTQPVGATNTANTAVSFSIVATGPGTLRYQWYRNGTNAILDSGGNTSTLSYSNVLKSYQGAYTCVVSNSFGAVASEPAILVVIEPPEVLRQPTNFLAAVGGSATFRVVAGGDPPLTYQWFFNVIYPIDGATNAVLVLTNLQPDQAGTYQVEISNEADTMHSREALLTVKFPPGFVTPLASQSVTQGHAATFTAAPSGDFPLSFQWFFNATNAIAGATNIDLIIANAQPANAGDYTIRVANEVGVATSAVATLTVLIPPTIVEQPTNLAVTIGSSASFSVAATGDAPLSYYWFFNRTNRLTAPSEPTLALPSVQPLQAGGYSVIVSNLGGVQTSAVATLTVITPPVITQQPASRVVAQGQFVSFNVAAAGIGPLSYQWLFNGTNVLSGATGPTFSIPNSQPANAGLYSASVSNRAGAVVSSAAQLSVESPPVFLQQPANRAVVAGGTAVFSVVVQAAEPLVYQWFFNGATPIPDGASATLTVTNAQAANVGGYSVRVTNTFGSAISSSASLVLRLPPVITQQPASLIVTQGNQAAFGVLVTGDGPFGYRWLFNDTNALSVANSPTLVISNAQPANAGLYSVLVTNDAASALSTSATLIVRVPPFVTLQPLDIAVTPDSPAVFTVVAGGDAPLQYQWFKDAVEIPAATDSNYTIENAQAANEGSYSVRVSNGVGSTNSASAALRVRNLPTIAQPPASQTVTQGQVTVFTVQAGGDGPFTYQWFFNSTNPIPGASNPTLSIPDTQPADAGLYSVRVTNLVGFAISPEAALTVRLIPTITAQPAGRIIPVGGSVTFSVEVSGEEPFTYQWRYQQTNHLADATNATLALNNVPLAQAGLYSVLVSNAVGFAISDGALLEVKLPPTIAQQPVSVISTQRLSASFSVVVNGDVPFAYQWFHHGTNPVPGATSAMLGLNNLQLADAGEYSVQVTNLVGSAQSAPALLTVEPLPEITTQPASLVVTQGNTALFTVTAAHDLPMTYQWRHHGTVLPEGTTTELTLANVQPASAGSYDVVVSSARGAVTSAVAVLTVRGLDFGDTPEPAYPTLLSADGARHVLLPGVFLGSLADPEPDGQPTPGANGDDTTAANDDDGVRLLSPLRVGQTTSVEIIASTNGVLNAWIDFGLVAGWSEPGDQIFTNQSLLAGTNVLAFLVPGHASVGTTLARFRFSTVPDASFTGLAADGEVEDYSLPVVPAADLDISQSGPSSVSAGSEATFTIHTTNRGPSSATGVMVFSQLSSRSTFVSVTTTQGSCTNAGGVVTCELGALSVGAGAVISMVVRAGLGTNSTRSSVEGNEFDPGPANNVSLRGVAGTATLPQFANSELILMPLPEAGPAEPYPASILVTGATGTVHKVTVSLRHVNHEFPDHMDVLLVGPQGRKVMLLSDAGGSNPLTDALLTFDDEAEGLAPLNAAFGSGSYRPSNYTPTADPMPAPAPGPLYAAALSVFNGADPNGFWSLYVVDDSLDDVAAQVPGFITDGWTLTITTADPLSDLAIAQSTQSASVPVGGVLRHTLAVSNRGPAAASALVRDVLPASVAFVSATASQGACAHDAGVVTCDLGSLLSGGAATITLEVMPTVSGLLTNTATVSGAELDPVQTNNSATVVTTVQPVANLRLSMSGPALASPLGLPVHYSIVVSNAGPDAASGVQWTDALPAGMTFISAASSQGQCSNAAGVVQCALGSLSPGGVASIQLSGRPSVSGLNSNFASVAALELDSVPADNTAFHLATINPSANLVLSASPLAANVAVGREFATILTVSNGGPSATDALLLDSLPPLADFVSATSARGSCSASGGQLQCQFTGLSPGESAPVILVLRSTVLGTLTNLAQVSGPLYELDSSNNASTNFAFVVPSADLALSMIDRPDPVFLSEDLIYTLAVTNQGPNIATSVMLTNTLPNGVSFISTVLGQGSCGRAGNLVTCSLGSLNPGAGATVSLVLRPALAGPITNRANVGSQTIDASPANNVATQQTLVLSSSGTFAGVSPVLTPVLGPASPFPSTIFVSGLTASVFHVRVALNNLSHSYADDLDVLLVGPGGQSTLLMSDCGGDFSMANVSLTFDDATANALPDSGAIFSGVVQPSNHGLEADLFPAPAPAGPYGTNLAVFNDTDPNGLWSLYLVDDADKDSGLLAGGWSLTFTTLNPLADVEVRQGITIGGQSMVSPDMTIPLTDPVPLAVGSNVVFTYSVTNRGPAAAFNVRLTNSVPSFLSSRSFVTSQGACNFVGDSLICALGSVPKGAVATVTVQGTSLVTGAATNSVTVDSDFIDLHPANNSSSVAIVFELPPVITLQPLSQTVPTGANVQFTTTAVGAAPLQYQWQRNGVDVPGATGPTLLLNNVSPVELGVYRLRVSNNVGVALSDPAVLAISGPPIVSAIADRAIDEDTDTGLIPFSVQDFDTAVETVNFQGDSSNPALVPPASIVFGGSGSNRTVRVTPLVNLSGTALVGIIVTDTTGAATTNRFTLDVRPVIDLIQIVTQPLGATVVTGSTAGFTVSAASTLPLAYQWQRNGENLDGATSPSLSLPNVELTNSGSYRVLITNADTNAISAVAELRVVNVPDPNIVSIVRNGANVTISFTTIAGPTYTLEYKNRFSDAEWTEAGSAAGTGGTASITDPVANAETRFYRVRAN